MNLYRWFKTQVYWLIPDSFKSQNVNEFNGDTDLVTVYKVTDQGEVYENRNVTLNQLSGLMGGGEYKEVFLRTNYLNTIQYGYSTLTTNNLTAVTVSTGVYRINIQNIADRPANYYKIEVNADVIGGYGVTDDIYRVAVDAGVTSATGIITFYIYKFNSNTKEFEAAAPINTISHPVHIRIYN